MSNVKVYKNNIKKTIGMIVLSTALATSSICIAGCEAVINEEYQNVEQQNVEQQSGIEDSDAPVFVFEKRTRADLSDDWEYSGVLITNKIPTQSETEKYEYIEMKKEMPTLFELEENEYFKVDDELPTYFFEEQTRLDLDDKWEISGILITNEMPTQSETEKYEYIDMTIDEESNSRER